MMDAALNSFKIIDDYSRLKSPVHRINPVVKLLMTVFYIIAAASFGNYNLAGLIPMALYPAALFVMSDLPFGFIMKKILIVQPFVLLIGIFDPIFDKNIISVGGFIFSQGWIALLTIVIKSIFILASVLIFAATTGMDNIGMSLRTLKVPKIFTLQLLLTYRYISVLISEAGRIRLAYSLKAPGRRGVDLKVWGSLAGMLLLRTLAKAERVYTAMRLRGFNGEYITGGNKKLRVRDILILTVCVVFFISARFIDLSQGLGNLFVK